MTIRFMIAVIAASVVIPSAALADCSQHRLVGSWRTYVLPNSTTWIACNFMVGRNGAVKRNSSCIGSGVAGSPVTGSITINNCVITGQFTLGRQSYVIKHAGFNVDQSQIGGVLRLADGKFAEFKSLRQ